MMKVGIVEFTFSQFLSATMGPSVALVSAPNTIPFSYKHPTMVVPVEVALGNPKFLFANEVLRREFSKENPASGCA